MLTDLADHPIHDSSKYRLFQISKSLFLVSRPAGFAGKWSNIAYMSGVDTSRVTALTIVTMQTIQVMLFLGSRPASRGCW